MMFDTKKECVFKLLIKVEHLELPSLGHEEAAPHPGQKKKVSDRSEVQGTIYAIPRVPGRHCLPLVALRSPIACCSDRSIHSQ